MEKLRGMGCFEAISTFPRTPRNLGKARGLVRKWEGLKLLLRKDLKAHLPTIPPYHRAHTCTYREIE